MTRIGSMFSGYGGLDLAAAEVFGGRVAWHADTDPAATKVLAARFPEAAQLGDVTAIRWRPEHTVDVLTGGFPCQDISQAGGRKGIGEGTRSGLWSAMAVAVAELRPPYVVVENVRALLKGADLVQSCDACRPPAVCPARSRLLDDRPGRPIRRSWFGSVLGDLARVGYDAAWCRLRASDVGAPHHRDRVFILAWPSPPADAGGAGLARDRLRRPAGPPPIGDGPRAAPRRPAPPDPQSHRRHEGRPANWGAYGPAIRRWENVLGRPAPAPVVAGASRGQPKLNPGFVEWMMGLPREWVTGVPGLTQNDQLRLLGNGVVPRQAATALRWLADTTAGDRGAP